MPASAGRVRMPHNNRMQASAALKTTPIWQKTIGHDPYAGQNEPTKTAQEEEQAKEKARQVLNVARQQNLTDGAQRDDFARKLYLGLKRGKQHREREGTGDGDPSRDRLTLDDLPSSSSEDEFVEIVAPSKSKRKKDHKKRKSRRQYSSDGGNSSSDEDSVSDSSRRGRKRKKRKHRKHKRVRQRRHRDDSSSSSETSSDESSDSGRQKRRRKHKKRTGKGMRKRNEKSRSSTNDLDATTSFVACGKYDGSRKGFVFQMGDQGLGYYADNKRVNR